MKVREIPRAKNEEENKNSKNELTLQQLQRAEKDFSVWIAKGLGFYCPYGGMLTSWSSARWGMGSETSALIGILERLYTLRRKTICPLAQTDAKKVCFSAGALSGEILPLKIHNPRLGLT